MESRGLTIYIDRPNYAAGKTGIMLSASSGKYSSFIMRRAGRTLRALLAALIVSSCTPESPALLRIGTSVWPGYEPLYLARDLNYLDSGVVRLVEYPSASEVMRSFRNGAIEAATLTLDEALLLLQNYADIRVILVLDVSHGADVILGKPYLKNIQEIAGRRVGVENTALGAFVLSRALQQAKLSRGDIRVVSLPVSDHERAYHEDAVDAVVTFEPVRTRLLKAGARLLFDSTQIPGEIVDVLVVRRDALDAHASQINNLVSAWFRAVAYLRTHPHDAARRMAKREGVSSAEFLDALRGVRIPDQEENRRLLTGNSPLLVESARKLAASMIEQRLLQKEADISALLDARPLLAAGRP